MGIPELTVVGVLTIVVWRLLASFAVGMAAEKRGRGQSPWFLLSFFLGPFFAVLLLIAYPLKRSEKGAPGAIAA
jgi:hypothetical protein